MFRYACGLAVVLCVCGAAAGEDPLRLKARAALALAFAGPRATYEATYAAAAKAGKPLVVWVGRPAGAVAGCVAVACDTFPGAEPGAVVVGVPDGTGFRRLDLPGEPTAAAVLHAVARAGAGGPGVLPVPK